MRASWLQGLLVLVGVTAGGAAFSLSGVVFLIVLFSPIVVAYRRDRLSLPIVFACLFLPAWPWAAYKAFSRGPRVAPTPLTSAADVTTPPPAQ